MCACGSKILMAGAPLSRSDDRGGAEGLPALISVAQGTLRGRSAIFELAVELGLDRGDLLRVRVLVDDGPDRGRDVAPGGDALVDERGEHPRAVRRHALGDAVEPGDRDADED